VTLIGELVKELPGIGFVEHAGRFYAPGVDHKQSDLSQEYEAVLNAANKWHINPVILWGVYGAETSHGSNIKTSSTGAVGPFQFEPATAKQYGYPTNANVTGVTNMTAFAKQADAAAHYLASLLPGGKGESKLGGKAWTAAWEKALRAYSGGGYGLAEVRQRGRGASKIMGSEAQNQAETETVESNPSEEDFFAKLAKLGVTIVLLLAGVLLVVYGIMVAVRPPDRALSLPKLVPA
jgi:hypothetical protein